MTDSPSIPKGEREAADLAHDALDRMAKAHRRGTGCHLTAEMIEALGLTFMGEVWGATRPALQQQGQER